MLRLIAVLLLLALQATGAEFFLKKTFPATNGTVLPYRLFVPAVKAGETYPLVIHFHGAGSRGNDNEKQLYLARVMSSAEVQAAHPCLVLAPQCPENRRWVDLDWQKTGHRQPAEPTPEMAAAMELIAGIMAAYPVDRRRIYVYGQSMGGYAVWDIIGRRPDWFAAAVPVCGGGDVTTAERIKNIPIWCCHGALDKTVPVENSRQMIGALRRLGAQVQYHEYPQVKHNAWDYAYTPEMIEWLFRQSRP